MRRIVAVVIVCSCCAIVWMSAATAQDRAPTDWMTANGDAQRSSWVRADAKISSKSLQKPGFQLLWKLKLNNQPRGLNSLTPPSLLERLIGYRGFRMLGFVGGSSDKVIVIDTDLGRLEWEKQLAPAAAAPKPASSLSCPGGMTAAVTRPTTVTIAPAPGATGGGRSNPARSAVGEPGAGAVTLARVRPTPTPPPPSAPTPAPVVPPRINPADPPGGQFGAGPFPIHALSSDGLFHSMHLSNGADFEPPVRFLPPNANASGLIVIAHIAYVVTHNECGGVPNGVWSLDLTTKRVNTWKSTVAGSAGVAFGPDGTVYAATGGGGEIANSLVALDRKTLAVRDWYSPGSEGFTSSPVIFEYKGRILIAAATANGRLHLLDTANLGGTDHQTPIASIAVSTRVAFSPGALASWQDGGRTRWILAPVTTSTGGISKTVPVATGAVSAWRIVDQNGVLKLQLGWTSRELVAPLPPTIINDVVFVTSTGQFLGADAKSSPARHALRSSPAVIFALDGLTGAELWNSGAALSSFTRGGALSGGALSGGVGQIYLGTHRGMLYAFGFPMEH